MYSSRGSGVNTLTDVVTNLPEMCTSNLHSIESSSMLPLRSNVSLAVSHKDINHQPEDIQDSNNEINDEVMKVADFLDVQIETEDHNAVTFTDVFTGSVTSGFCLSNTADKETIPCLPGKRPRNPDKWKQRAAKLNRNSGREYVTTRGRLVPEKTISGTCPNNCTFKCNINISAENRKQIFDRFWALADVSKQREFIVRCLIFKAPSERKLKSIGCGLSTRNNNAEYHFEVNHRRVRVCKKFFMLTLDVSDKMISTAIKKKDGFGFVKPDLRGISGNRKKLDPEILNGIRNHINSFPRVESPHAQSSKEFIDGSLTVAEMHRQYIAKCQLEGKPFGKLYAYQRIFNEEFNIELHKPRKRPK